MGQKTLYIGQRTICGLVEDSENPGTYGHRFEQISQEGVMQRGLIGEIEICSPLEYTEIIANGYGGRWSDLPESSDFDANTGLQTNYGPLSEQSSVGLMLAVQKKLLE